MELITIDTERCTGCGACVEVCPTGALYLVDGVATVDGARCRESKACLAACPTGAVTLAAQEGPAAETVGVPALSPMPDVVRVKTQPMPAPLRSMVLPAVGAALAWAGRAILPELLDFALDTLDRQPTRLKARGEARSRETRAPRVKGGGRQHRHRQRRGERTGRT